MQAKHAARVVANTDVDARVIGVHRYHPGATARQARNSRSGQQQPVQADRLERIHGCGTFQHHPGPTTCASPTINVWSPTACTCICIPARKRKRVWNIHHHPGSYNKRVVYNSRFMQTISKHIRVWNTTTSPYADHMCNPTIHVWSTSASSCRQARNKQQKSCETQHHPTQSRSRAGSKNRCESHRRHPGQGHKSRRGPQHGQYQTEQCSNAKLSITWKTTYRPIQKTKRMQF